MAERGAARVKLDTFGTPVFANITLTRTTGNIMNVSKEAYGMSGRSTWIARLLFRKRITFRMLKAVGIAPLTKASECNAGKHTC